MVQYYRIAGLVAEMDTFGRAADFARPYMIDFEGDLKKGKYPTKIVLYTLDDKKVAENEFVVEVIDAVLPEQETIVTNWFYADCLAD